jgi:hypothetical protein
MTDLNIDTSKSYATEENLTKALKRSGLDGLRPLIVLNRAGRYTAVFGLHISGLAQNGNITAAARHGFMTID